MRIKINKYILICSTILVIGLIIMFRPMDSDNIEISKVNVENEKEIDSNIINIFNIDKQKISGFKEMNKVNISEEIDVISIENNSDIYIMKFDLNKDKTMDYKLLIDGIVEEQPIEPIIINTDICKNKYMNEYKYEIELSEYYGKLKITLHEVIDSGILYYVEYIPNNKKSNGLTFTIEAPKTDCISIMEGYYEDDIMKYNISNVTASQSFNNILNLIDGSNNHIMLGRVFFEKDIGKTVKTVTKIKQDNTIIVNDKMIYKYTLPVKDGFSTKVSGMVSLNDLINDKNEQFNLATLSVLDLANKKYIWDDGLYDDNPNSYEPSTRNDFYRTACGYHIQACYWVIEKGSVFKNLGLSLMYSYGNLYNDKNYIPTIPRSNWLYNDYKIDGGFYDTRFNTDTISSLMYIQEVYPDDNIKEKLDLYFEFYTNFVNDNNFLVDGNIFVPDYMDYNGNEIMPHCSLNHMLAEMTVMYRYYLVNKDVELFNLAETFLHSIINTKDNWIKSNGDLYYCVTRDGKYIKDDYKLVTLNDLDKALYYLEQVYKEVPEDFMTIYNSKRNWAIRHGYISE